MDDLGWQALLAAEVSPSKCSALIRESSSFCGSVAKFIQEHPILSEQERKRAAELFQDKFAKALEAGVKIVTRKDLPPQAEPAAYPPALFAWGEFGCTFQPCLGIVGTRAASTYGKAAAIKFAEAFARAGVTVVSGGALGIDAAAHRGALSVEGKTVAVLAGGIEQVYPAVHAGLFSKVREHGCLVSQHAIGSRPAGFQFLSRNHLIAALSHAILVIEAPERSGSISTVHAALDQGKQVFVVPSNIDNTNFKGSHALIRDGATLVDHPDQVLEAIGVGSKPALNFAPDLSSAGKKIIDALRGEPLTPEFLVERTAMDTSEVMAELTMLEIDGLVMRDGGKYVVRI